MLLGNRIILLGNLVLRNLLPVDRKLAHAAFRVHGTVALILLGLIGMHVAAARYRHVVRKNGVLAGMVPALRQRGRTVVPAPLPQE